MDENSDPALCLTVIHYLDALGPHSTRVCLDTGKPTKVSKLIPPKLAQAKIKVVCDS